MMAQGGFVFTPREGERLRAGTLKRARAEAVRTAGKTTDQR